MPRRLKWVVTMSKPFLLQRAVTQVSSLFSSSSILFGREISAKRCMRGDRIRSSIALVTVMLNHCLLQKDGVISHIDMTTRKARPMPVSELARLAGLTYKTAHRCIRDLVELDLLVVEKQIKRKSLGGPLEVSVCVRKLTDRFWEMLGLLKKYRQAVAWAKQTAKYIFLYTFKRIKVKVREVATSSGASGTVASVAKMARNFWKQEPGCESQAIGRQLAKMKTGRARE